MSRSQDNLASLVRGIAMAAGCRVQNLYLMYIIPAVSSGGGAYADTSGAAPLNFEHDNVRWLDD